MLSPAGSRCCVTGHMFKSGTDVGSGCPTGILAPAIRAARDAYIHFAALCGGGLLTLCSWSKFVSRVSYGIIRSFKTGSASAAFCMS